MCRFDMSVVLGLLIPYPLRKSLLRRHLRDRISLLVGVAGQSTTLVPRCFQFTWLGPRWNNESVFLNATCSDATRLSSGVPCFQPLVVSYDGTWPDVNYIWANHEHNATCILANNDVCATYTYYFDGHVENSTYMCTRVIDTAGQAITSGCYTQTNGSFTTRACFCRSIPGGIPCNGSSANAIIASTVSVVLAVVLMLYKDFV